MSKNLKTKKKQEQTQPKTRYDRKMEARRKQAAKEKRHAMIAKIVLLVILVGIVGAAGYYTVDYCIKVHKATNDTYLTIGDHDVTQLEYDYYFNSTVNDYLTTYSYFLSYIGLDTTLPYDEQEYSEDMTWQDYFEQSAIQQLTQTYALMDDAEANGFEYDPTEECDEYMETAKETAKENSTSLRTYFKTMFGEYATKNNVKQFLENTFVASAYYNQLLEDNAPTDEEINDYYLENQHSYDLVTYYSFSFDEADYDTTDDADDTTESADVASGAYKDASDMAARAEDGEDFESLCYEYASEDEKENYNTEDSEYSLTSSVTANSIDSLLEDWLYDDSREEGDVTIIADEDSGIYYVLKFVSKEYDDSCVDTISSTLASNTTSEYLTALTEAYEVIDIKGEIGYLQSTEDTEEETDDSDSLLNTDIIE